MLTNRPLHRILVVDDDRFIRAAVERALTLSGYAVQACASGAEAVQQAPGFEPDLLLLDVVMPGLDGPGTLRVLRAMPATAEVPVAFLTATTDRAATDALRSLGAIAVLAKPFDLTRLGQDLAAAWAAARDGEAAGAEQLRADLAALRSEYAAALPGEVDRLKAEGLPAGSPAGAPDGLDAVCHIAHALYGSGASFGFAAVSEAAGRLERGARQMRSEGPSGSRPRHAKLRSLLEELEQAVHEAVRSTDGADAGGAHAPSDASDGAPLPPLQAPAAGARPRLLVVDDVDALRHRYALLLGAAGFDVDGVGSGTEALERVRQHDYDLILLDLCMPGMDGFETQRRLRQEPATLDTPIVFMTASASVDVGRVQQARALGMSGFAPKSLSSAQLVQEIRHALCVSTPAYPADTVRDAA